jgi:dihydroorotate dehydrogenase (NAD+) catalytic subunit
MATSVGAFELRLGRGGKGDALVLRGPVIAAAGCFPLQGRRWTAADVSPLGAVCTPSIAVRTRPGGAGFEVIEAPAGVIIRGGYPTVSPRRALEEIGSRWWATGTPLIATIDASDPDECLAVVATIAELEAFAGIEVSLVGPGRDFGGASVVAAIATLVGRVRRLWPGTLLVKLFPVGGSTPGLAGQVQAAGADAITLGGGLAAVAGAGEDADGAIVTGRLVGPAGRPLVLRQVAALARATDLPVIAGGGIASAEDVLTFLAAGAAAVQVGSIALRSPLAAVEIARAVDGRLRQPTLVRDPGA